MNHKTKSAIIKYITDADPQSKIVTLKPSADLSTGTVEFNARIRQHRVERMLTDEKYVEAYLIVKLVTEYGYKLDRFELQKAYEAGHPAPNRPRVDIILNRTDGKPFFFIEAKSPEQFEPQLQDSIQHQLYSLADHERVNGLKYLVYFAVNLEGDSLVDYSRIIDFQRFTTYDAWTSAGSIAVDLFPARYGEAKKSKYVNKRSADLLAGERKLSVEAGPESFAALRRDLHNVLWGGGGMFYNDIFANLTKIFLAKIYDEETTSQGKPFRFQIKTVDGEPESPADTYATVNELYKEAQQGFLGYSALQVEEFKGIDIEKISKPKVAYVVQRLQGYSLVRNSNSRNHDVLGEFFEGIVEQGFKQSRGQFFTHSNIVRFLIEALEIPQRAVHLVSGGENPTSPRLPLICDPACGSGTFLIEAMKDITRALAEIAPEKQSLRTRAFLEALMPPSKPNRWAADYVYGLEVNSDLALATKVNMVLHGDGNINILAADGLAAFEKYAIRDKVSALRTETSGAKDVYSLSVNGQFDFILSNPPFSIKPDSESKKDYERRFEFGAGAKSENLFLERWYQLLRDGGRVGAILPESVFDTPSARQTRLFLYRYFKIDAIIALPYLAFKPYTSTKTCILIATKRGVGEVRAYDEAWTRYANLFDSVCSAIGGYRRKPGPKILSRLRALFESSDTIDRAVLCQLVGTDDASPSAFVNAVRDLPATWREPEGDPWIFENVAHEFDYPIFFSQLDEIGYKRRRQGADLIRRNELFQADEFGRPARRFDGETVLERFLSRGQFPQRLTGFVSQFRFIAAQKFLRCDPKYRWFWDILEGRAFEQARYDYVPLSKFVAPLNTRKVTKGELDGERKLIELEDVEPLTGRLINVQLVDEVGGEKVEFGNADFVFSKLEPYLGKVLRNDPAEEYIGSTEWIPLRVHRDQAAVEFVWALLLSGPMLRAFKLLQSGKRHARINVTDFRNIQVPNVPRDDQNVAVSALRPLWEQIGRLMDEILKSRGVAEDVFEDYVGSAS